MTNIDTATATAFMAANKGNMINVALTDNTVVQGTAISVNSKGVNIKDAVTGKVRSFGLSRVTDLRPLAPVGPISTADLAAMVGMTPKALRVQLRAMGMGVGQGRAYGFDAHTVATVRAALGK